MSDLESKLTGWCQSNAIRLCILFGSQATGRTHAMSDVDLALWPSQPPEPRQKLRWIVELQRLLDREVSLVIVSPRLDPVLGMEIVRHGQVIMQATSDIWQKERAKLWYAYNDSLPFRRAALEELQKFAKESSHGA